MLSLLKTETFSPFNFFFFVFVSSKECGISVGSFSFNLFRQMFGQYRNECEHKIETTKTPKNYYRKIMSWTENRLNVTFTR